MGNAYGRSRSSPCPSGPRLCGIYLRDVLSLLPRKGINAGCRVVSRHLNSTVVGCPELPRLRFNELSFYATDDEEHSWYWKRISLRGECCRDLEVSGRGTLTVGAN